MQNLTDCYVLNNGVEIPCIGFGTWQIPDGETAVMAVKEAMKIIDTMENFGGSGLHPDEVDF